MSLQDPAVQAQIAQLLDFGTPEAPAELTPQTLATLEALVGTLYNPATPPHEAKIADDCLKQFKEHENAWFQCKTVLDQSQSAETKFFALSCLDDVIKTQWRGLAPAQSEGMKEFIVETVISKSSSFATLQAEGVFIKKLDQILIQIVKQVSHYLGGVEMEEGGTPVLRQRPLHTTLSVKRGRLICAASFCAQPFGRGC